MRGTLTTLQRFEIHFTLNALVLFMHVARGCTRFAEVVNTSLYDPDNYPSLVAAARTSGENQN